MNRISHRFLLLLVSVCLAAGIWFLWNLQRTAGWYNYVHRRIYKKTSVARLQTLARETATIADSLDNTNGFIFAKVSGSIPTWIKDIDPQGVMIFRDIVDINYGIGQRYGFVFERSETSSNLWVIMRYDGTNRVKISTYDQRMSSRGSRGSALDN
jgi:hypothetical protein